MAILSNKVTVVTGASSGIGEATARVLAEAGATVILVARRQDRLNALVEAITDAGGTAVAIAADMTDQAQVTSVIGQAEQSYGKVDILINNAGVMLLGKIDGVDTEEWRRMVDLNLMGLMYATHAALPGMKRQGHGHIVNVSSVAGRVVNPISAVYAATKHAVGAFSEGLRKQESKNGIRVTVIEPGAVRTELSDHITDPDIQKQVRSMYSDMEPLESEDIAAAIFYAVTQPERVNVNEILIRPTAQEM